MPLFVILTLFPDAVAPYLAESILKLAQEKGLARILAVDFRDFARDRHRTVDDRPFGGGPGMVLKPEPIVDCVEWLEDRYGSFRKLALTPAGQCFRQADARQMAEQLLNAEASEANSGRVLLLAGRYEGYDERVREELNFEEFSIGDFVLAGGELPALCVLEAIVRLLPGVLGDERSAQEDSFQNETQLDHPHYTRPRSFRGRKVPQVLFDGNHAAIADWRQRAALTKTRQNRPDLLPHAHKGKART